MRALDIDRDQQPGEKKIRQYRAGCYLCVCCAGSSANWGGWATLHYELWRLQLGCLPITGAV